MQLSDKDLFLSYLPLAHIFGRVVEEAMIYHGATIAYWQGDVKLLLDDVDAAKPTVFCGVPRVFDRVYNGEWYLLLCRKSCSRAGNEASAVKGPSHSLQLAGAIGFLDNESTSSRLCVPGAYLTSCLFAGATAKVQAGSFITRLLYKFGFAR